MELALSDALRLIQETLDNHNLTLTKGVRTLPIVISHMHHSIHKELAAKVTEFLAGRDIKSYQAMDEVQNGLVWEPTDAHISKVLNKQCYKYNVCKL